MCVSSKVAAKQRADRLVSWCVIGMLHDKHAGRPATLSYLQRPHWIAECGCTASQPGRCRRDVAAAARRVAVADGTEAAAAAPPPGSPDAILCYAPSPPRAATARPSLRATAAAAAAACIPAQCPRPAPALVQTRAGQDSLSRRSSRCSGRYARLRTRARRHRAGAQRRRACSHRLLQLPAASAARVEHRPMAHILMKPPPSQTASRPGTSAGPVAGLRELLHVLMPPTGEE